MLCQEGGVTAATASPTPLRFGSGRSFYRLLVRAGFFIDVSERSDRILKNAESSDVTRKCSKTTASAFAKGQAPCPLSISHSQRPVVPGQVAGFLFTPVHSPTSGRSRWPRVFRTPWGSSSLTWLITYHSSEPVEFC